MKKRRRDAKVKARPEGLSPTEALRLLMTGGLAARVAADRLNTWMRTEEPEKCHVWCNGTLLPPDYVATSLVVVEKGRWRADVVSSTREAWEKSRDAYVFEFDADEVRALLPRQETDRQADEKARTDDKPKRRRKSREQEAIRQWADTKWPDGYEHIELREIIFAAKHDKEFKKKFPSSFPERTKFSRALDRRKD